MSLVGRVRCGAVGRGGRKPCGRIVAEVHVVGGLLHVVTAGGDVLVFDPATGRYDEHADLGIVPCPRHSRVAWGGMVMHDSFAYPPAGKLTALLAAWRATGQIADLYWAPADYGMLTATE